jgi:hypothetical protein
MSRIRAARRHGRRQPLSPAAREFLETGQLAPGATLDDHLTTRGESLGRLWRLHRAETLPDFIRAQPGRRPAAWWAVEAPEKARRRLGGVGTPAHEVLASEPVFDSGIPAYWVTAWQVAYYTGRTRDVHGEPIGVEYRGSRFRGQAIDPQDPPRYESQASYLKRHRLLGAEERACLTAAAFQPEPVEPEHEEEETNAER